MTGEGEPEREFVEVNIDGKPYVQAELGRAYAVKINVYRDKNGKFPFELMRIGLFVDGCDVNYWKRVDSSLNENSDFMSAKFMGFKKNTTELLAFVFASPTAVSNKSSLSSSSLLSSSLGSIRVVFHEAYIKGGLFHNNVAFHEPPSSSDASYISQDGKKVHQLPSVATRAGAKVSTAEPFNPLVTWLNVTKEPQKELTFSIHSESVLRLIKQVSGESRLNGEEIKVGDKRLHSATSHSSNASGRGGRESDDDNNDDDGEDDDVQLLKKPAREVECIDLTADEPQLSTILINQGDD